jgi:hypothetical protein
MEERIIYKTKITRLGHFVSPPHFFRTFLDAKTFLAKNENEHQNQTGIGINTEQYWYDMIIMEKL